MERSKLHIQKNKGVVYCSYEGVRVGSLTYVNQPNGSVLIGDIEVVIEAFLRFRLFHRLVGRLLPSWKIIKPRRHGIGTMLLDCFLSDCDARQVPFVFGNICAKDDSQPFLRGWYQKHGFEILPPKSHGEDAVNFFDAVCQVVRNLPTETENA